MILKDKFVAFAELLENAMVERYRKGTTHPDVVEAFEKANSYKRDILNMIDNIEKPRESEPIDRNYKGFEKQERYHEYMKRRLREEDLT